MITNAASNVKYEIKIKANDVNFEILNKLLKI